MAKKHSRPEQIQVPSINIVSNWNRLLCLFVFDLGSLLINNIKPVEWNKQAFDRLVLPHKIKDIVKSLGMVRAPQSRSEGRHMLNGMRDDLIVGKGNGLIMLLHGGPGTGKTLTAVAFSVAELAEMPLYSVTCGDIGTKPEQVENYLQVVLMLGKRWNCVLLLDEADVFLEERSLADLERNSLVSVFLRTLEYYEGILVLTSNRIGIFDAAFTSRIQVALHYDTLNASRRRVWQNFFDMLHTENPDNIASTGIEGNVEKVDMDDLRAHMDELASHEMNGRQIRNVFNTARQLAIFKKETFAWSHLSQALATVGDFNKYLRRLHGHSEDQWARDERIR
ncbi:P-loop containing nucleoside triphosphate hydrolase protein [Dichotomopilus funicola]|uniref:P-loop containing nucleoside triphosphate hydrolase protein n=1 Tax=Dichotomopilus funicola TaxID=1934379 RepID=A0AAN6V3K6_9PEZI|nr:P-loop containing nucleoside triphosphate hydrolase protein [Dichotomopilus funicola]